MERRSKSFRETGTTLALPEGDAHHRDLAGKGERRRRFLKGRCVLRAVLLSPFTGCGGLYASRGPGEIPNHEEKARREQQPRPGLHGPPSASFSSRPHLSHTSSLCTKEKTRCRERVPPPPPTTPSASCGKKEIKCEKCCCCCWCARPAGRLVAWKCPPSWCGEGCLMAWPCRRPWQPSWPRAAPA